MGKAQDRKPGSKVRTSLGQAGLSLSLSLALSTQEADNGADLSSSYRELNGLLCSRAKVHICVRCDCPVAIYGRLSPCRHAFCLQCAEEMGATCYLCFKQIEGIERVDASARPLHLCGVCGVSFGSAEALLESVKASGGKCCRGGKAPGTAIKYA